MSLTIGEANAVNTVLRALANEEPGPSWESMEAAGRLLANSANKVLMAGYTAESFRAALARGQGFRPKSNRERAEESGVKVRESNRKPLPVGLKKRGKR